MANRNNNTPDNRNNNPGLRLASTKERWARAGSFTDGPGAPFFSRALSCSEALSSDKEERTFRGW